MKKNNKSKILLLCYDFPPAFGGNETYIFNLFKSLSNTGESIIVVCGSEKKGSNFKINNASICNSKIIRVPGFKEFCEGDGSTKKILGHMSSIINNFKPDVLGTFGIMPALIGIILKDWFKYKLIFTNCNTPNSAELTKSKQRNSFVKNNFAFNPIRKFVFSNKKIDKFVSLSEYFNSHYIEFGGDAEKSVIIYPSVNLKQLKILSKRKENIRKSLKINKRDFVICCPVRVVPRKRIEDIILALKHLSDSDIKLIITGLSNKIRPDYHLKILNQIKKYKMGTNVLFKNISFTHDQVLEIIAASDMVILTSQDEGLGICLIEALACNTIVAATNIPGVNEIINKNNGFLFNLGDVSQICNIIKKIKGKKINFKNLIKNMNKTISNKFSSEKERKLIEIYRKKDE